MNRNHPLAAIFGCAGTTLGPDEFRFIREANPLGFIVFARNISNPDATRALVASFREAVGRDDAPVLIDQEGGRVARLRPPHWRKSPPARTFVERASVRGQAAAIEAVRTNFRLIAAELTALGIDVDCAPVADVPVPGAHDIIGDRAYGGDPTTIALFGRAAADGLLDGGVIPVVKHVPGHGRAQSDSHHELPVVAASREELERTDFAPFRALADLPWAMTAHVKYLAIDPDRPATTSAYLIENVIRRHIGFEGLLLSDDISMNALDGSIADRTRASLFAGCDVVLHCNGDIREMEQIALAARPLDDEAATRVAAGDRVRRERRRAGFDVGQAEARLSEFLVG